MTRKRVRVSLAEQAARRIVAMPGVRQSAREAAQARLEQMRAERSAPHRVRLDAIAAREGRA